MENYARPTHQYQRRKVRLDPVKVIVAILFIALIVVTVVFATVLTVNNQPHKLTYEYGYEDCTVEGGLLYVRPAGKYQAAVRSEPIAALHEYTVYAGTPAGAAGYGIDSTSVNTSYGRLKDRDGDGTMFQVSRVRKCAALDEVNGPYYGIYLSDLSEAELKLLPSKVTKDPDGIVWLSANEKVGLLDDSNIIPISK